MCLTAVQQAEIPGPHEVFIQHGSTISLQCEVRAGVEAVGVVRWYHGDKPLNYSSPRGGISMEVSSRYSVVCGVAYGVAHSVSCGVASSVACGTAHIILYRVV